jgi:RND family efflux transporter MFP subunit
MNVLKSQLLSSCSQIQQTLLDFQTIIISNGNSLDLNYVRQMHPGKLEQAQTYYYNVKNSFDPFYNSLKTAVDLSDDQLITDANAIKSYDSDLLTAITITTDALSVLSTSTTITQESTLSADGSTLSGGLTSLNVDLQTLLNVKLGLTSSGDVSASSVDSAKYNYDQQTKALEALKAEHKVNLNAKHTNISNLQSELKINEAALAAGQANLNQVKAPPRAVDIAALKSQIAAANVDLQLALESYEKTLLRAPIDGILTRKNVEEGEQFTFQINNSAVIPVFEMISTQKYKINANIAEVDIEKIKVGDKAKIKLDAIPGETFDGTIVSIDPVETKIQDVVFYKAEVIIDSTDERIKPGMTSDVVFILSEANGVLTVPEKALVKDNNGEYVRILENGQVKNIKVITGIINLSGDVEIKDGLTEGQQVILKITNG